MTQPIDPFANDSGDAFDPFADDTKPEDVKSGGGGKGNGHSFPTWGDLDHHVIMLKPTAYDPKAPGYQPGDKEREEFTVELTVLAGEPIELSVRELDETKGSPTEGKWVDRGKKETLSEWPVRWKGVHVYGAKLIGQLKAKFSTDTQEPKNGGIWVGTLRKVPSSVSPKQYKTSDEIDAAIAEYFASGGKRGYDGKNAAWQLTNFTPQDIELARAAWRAQQEEDAAA